MSTVLLEGGEGGTNGRTEDRYARVASELIRLADARPVEEYQKYAMKNGKRLARACLAEREENGRLRDRVAELEGKDGEGAEEET